MECDVLPCSKTAVVRVAARCTEHGDRVRVYCRAHYEQKAGAQASQNLYCNLGSQADFPFCKLHLNLSEPITIKEVV